MYVCWFAPAHRHLRWQCSTCSLQASLHRLVSYLGVSTLNQMVVFNMQSVGLSAQTSVLSGCMYTQLDGSVQHAVCRPLCTDQCPIWVYVHSIRWQCSTCSLQASLHRLVSYLGVCTLNQMVVFNMQSVGLSTQTSVLSGCMYTQLDGSVQHAVCRPLCTDQCPIWVYVHSIRWQCSTCSLQASLHRLVSYLGVCTLNQMVVFNMQSVGLSTQTSVLSGCMYTQLDGSVQHAVCRPLCTDQCPIWVYVHSIRWQCSTCSLQASLHRLVSYLGVCTLNQMVVFNMQSVDLSAQTSVLSGCMYTQLDGSVQHAVCRPLCTDQCPIWVYVHSIRWQCSTCSLQASLHRLVSYLGVCTLNQMVVFNMQSVGLSAQTSVLSGCMYTQLDGSVQHAVCRPLCTDQCPIWVYVHSIRWQCSTCSLQTSLHRLVSYLGVCTLNQMVVFNMQSVDLSAQTSVLSGCMYTQLDGSVQHAVCRPLYTDQCPIWVYVHSIRWQCSTCSLQTSLHRLVSYLGVCTLNQMVVFNMQSVGLSAQTSVLSGCMYTQLDGSVQHAVCSPLCTDQCPIWVYVHSIRWQCSTCSLQASLHRLVSYLGVCTLNQMVVFNMQSVGLSTQTSVLSGCMYTQLDGSVQHAVCRPLCTDQCPIWVYVHSIRWQCSTCSLQASLHRLVSYLGVCTLNQMVVFNMQSVGLSAQTSVLSGCMYTQLDGSVQHAVCRPLCTDQCPIWVYVHSIRWQCSTCSLQASLHRLVSYLGVCTLNQMVVFNMQSVGLSAQTSVLSGCMYTQLDGSVQHAVCRPLYTDQCPIWVYVHSIRWQYSTCSLQASLHRLVSYLGVCMLNQMVVFNMQSVGLSAQTSVLSGCMYTQLDGSVQHAVCRPLCTDQCPIWVYVHSIRWQCSTCSLQASLHRLVSYLGVCTLNQMVVFNMQSVGLSAQTSVLSGCMYAQLDGSVQHAVCRPLYTDQCPIWVYVNSIRWQCSTCSLQASLHRLVSYLGVCTLNQMVVFNMQSVGLSAQTSVLSGCMYTQLDGSVQHAVCRPLCTDQCPIWVYVHSIRWQCSTCSLQASLHRLVSYLGVCTLNQMVVFNMQSVGLSAQTSVLSGCMYTQLDGSVQHAVCRPLCTDQCPIWVYVHSIRWQCSTCSLQASLHRLVSYLGVCTLNQMVVFNMQSVGLSAQTSVLSGCMYAQLDGSVQHAVCRPL